MSSFKRRLDVLVALGLLALGMAAMLPAGAAADSWHGAHAIFDVGAGMKVTIQGGRGGYSNCTNDEAHYSFTTTGNGERKEFWFTAKSSGSCFYESSYSYFKVTVEDHGKLLGWGEMILKQQSVQGYFAGCERGSSDWWRDQIKCENVGNAFDRVVRIYRVK